jgi:CPA1 family monovalent cation:H+ antiporter
MLRGTRLARYQIAATILCAYGAYFLADYLRLSGIFAAIACGIALRRYERSWITLRIVADVERFWDIAAVLANALVFFMVGAALDIGRLAESPVFTLACIAGVTVARAAVSSMLLLGPYPREWVDVVRTSGMRGALCLALALAIPASLPERNAIVAATFAVSLATILVGAFTLDPTVRRVARG